MQKQGEKIVGKQSVAESLKLQAISPPFFLSFSFEKRFCYLMLITIKCATIQTRKGKQLHNKCPKLYQKA